MTTQLHKKLTVLKEGTTANERNSNAHIQRKYMEETKRKS